VLVHVVSQFFILVYEYGDVML